MRLLSLCSGIGAIDLAAEMAGFEIAGQVEYDPFCQQVLTKHWPHVKRMSDIKDVVGDEFGTIDVVAGGIPCQPFSRAGKRKGTEDDRHLWPYAFAIIKVAKPTWVLIENVAGFIELALDLIATDLEGEGYEVQAFVLPAAAVEAPHERQRCFIMAYLPSIRSRTRWTQSEKQRWTPNTDCISTPNVEDTTGGRQRQHYSTRTATRAQHHALQSGAGHTQSRLGRVLNGATHWMDGHRWPALLGEEQHEWEPPRTIPRKSVAFRSKRLKALGNAVVPQQIYPFFQYMMQAEEQSA